MAIFNASGLYPQHCHAPVPLCCQHLPQSRFPRPVPQPRFPQPSTLNFSQHSTLNTQLPLFPRATDPRHLYHPLADYHGSRASLSYSALLRQSQSVAVQHSSSTACCCDATTCQYRYNAIDYASASPVFFLPRYVMAKAAISVNRKITIHPTDSISPFFTDSGAKTIFSSCTPAGTRAARNI